MAYPTSELKPRAEEVSSARTIGDPSKKVSRHYEDILDQVQGQVPDLEVPEGGESLQVEHTSQNDPLADLQALGKSSQDHVAKLHDLTLVEEDAAMPAQPMNQNDAMDLPQSGPRKASPVRRSISSRITEAMTRAEVDMQLDDQAHRTSQPYSVPSYHDDKNLDSGVVESQLIEWQRTGQPSDGTEALWRMYSTLTHELAWSLCELLRLILEPTRATRLRGDYRTGKRLNMKKIIPYIASEFTKDKIWLRRTHPSQREYQVLIALDDSKSMAESHSEHLAFQTLALVTKALTRLEAGDVAVASFGEKVQMLHSFDAHTFNDSDGTRIIDNFGFNQTSTNVLLLMETSLQVLAEAREKRATRSATASELWQLEIIISDGVCANHEKLRSTLRRMREQRVLVVFIILDTLHQRSGTSTDDIEKQSILELKEVRGDLTWRPYLETFPFEYYIVLRSVDALGDVLAATLREFFERMAEI
jgi:midasin